MKKIKFAFIANFLLALITGVAQPNPTITVNGRYIIGNCGDTLVLKGVNYAAYNWGYSPNQLRIDQIALSGANVVRIPWYAASNQPLYSDYAYLDSAISKCIQYDMIPVIDLHDQTCQNSHGATIELANFFTDPAILSIIQKHKHSLIVNPVNESLYVNWTGNAPQATQQYLSTYTTIITNLRQAGIDVPLMIDGPDCGTNLDVLANTGPALLAADPLHNLIFSAHAYWYAYANNDSATYLAKINNAMSVGIPFIFGEVANLQDDVTLCQYTLNYKPLLSICESKKIGWIAWSWDNDGCSQRQVTTAGNYNSLTTYGNVMVNNPVYGIKNTAKRSRYLISNTCATTQILPPIRFEENIHITESPFEITLLSKTEDILQIEMLSITGQSLRSFMLNPGQEVAFSRNQYVSGVYLFMVKSAEGMTYRKIIL